jgi:hypothetical protein
LIIEDVTFCDIQFYLPPACPPCPVKLKIFNRG